MIYLLAIIVVDLVLARFVLRLDPRGRIRAFFIAAAGVVAGGVCVAGAFVAEGGASLGLFYIGVLLIGAGLPIALVAGLPLPT